MKKNSIQRQLWSSEPMINSRNKGKRAEREVAEVLQPIVDEVFKYFGLESPEVKRNLVQQSREGGTDLVGTPGIAVEVKFHAGYQDFSNWWEQTVQQANTAKALPVLFYRKNHQPWRVRMMGALLYSDQYVLSLVDITAEDFLTWYSKFLHVFCEKNLIQK